MTLTGIIILIIAGIALLLLEILVIPGGGLVGLAGILLMIIGIYFAYQINEITGHYSLGLSVLLSLVAVVLAFRAKTWERVSLKESLKEKSNLLAVKPVKEGDKGKAISRISPIGKAFINEEYYEVRSFGDYIAENTEIKVVKTEGNKIFVQPI